MEYKKCQKDISNLTLVILKILSELAQKHCLSWLVKTILQFFPICHREDVQRTDGWKLITYSLSGKHPSFYLSQNVTFSHLLFGTVLQGRRLLYYFLQISSAAFFELFTASARTRIISANLTQINSFQWRFFDIFFYNT